MSQLSYNERRAGTESPKIAIMAAPSEDDIKAFLAREHEKNARFRQERTEERIEKLHFGETLLLGAGFPSNPKRGYHSLLQQQPQAPETLPSLRRKKSFTHETFGLASDYTSPDKLLPPVPQFARQSFESARDRDNSSRASSRKEPHRPRPHQRNSSTSRIVSYIETSADILNRKRNSLTQSFRDSATRAKEAIYHLPYASDSDTSIESFYCQGESSRPGSEVRPSTGDLDRRRRLSSNVIDPWTSSQPQYTTCQYCHKAARAGLRGLCAECQTRFGRHQHIEEYVLERNNPFDDDDDEVPVELPLPPEASTKVARATPPPILQNPFVMPRVPRTSSPTTSSTPESQPQRSGRRHITPPSSTSSYESVESEVKKSRLGLWSRYNTLGSSPDSQAAAAMLSIDRDSAHTNGRWPSERRKTNFYDLYGEALAHYDTESPIDVRGIRNPF